MYIRIHLVQCSSGIDAKFTVETKQLCNVYVTARARAKQPIRATVAGRLASRKLDRPCLASVSCFHLPYQYITFLHGCMYCFCFEFVLIYSFRNLE